MPVLVASALGGVAQASVFGYGAEHTQLAQESQQLKEDPGEGGAGPVRWLLAPGSEPADNLSCQLVAASLLPSAPQSIDAITKCEDLF